MSYSSLHNHSEFSVLDGFGHPKEYFERAREIGLTAIAITEHGNMCSAPYFDKLSKEYPDVKLIFGVELYECFDISVQEKENKYFHLVALAKNENGRKALNEIITQSNLKGFYYKPRVDLEMLKNYGDDIIISSACLASKLARTEDFDKCVDYINEYKSYFKHFYLEMQSHDNDEQCDYNHKILTLSKATNTPFIITTDSHAATKEDLEFQGYHVRIARDTETANEIYSGCYLQSEQEIHSIMDKQIGKENVSIGLRNTNAITEMIEEVHLPWQNPCLPTFPLPEGFNSNFEYLKHLCDIGYKFRGVDKMPQHMQDERKKRIEYELSVIEQMGFSGYFLIVWDYINYAKNNNIIVGDGRGSGGGSFVVYLLGITELDPITNNLIFERFLNPERVSMPDIDCDFADRGLIIDYLTKKYGEEHVCQILNINYITPNVAIRDTARVLGIPYAVSEKISSKFNDGTFDECLKNNEDIVEKYNDYSELFRIAARISGRVRNYSMHAGGVVVFDNKVSDYAPMKLGSNNEHVIQVDKKVVEEIGGVKFDILGVKTLAMVQEAMTLSGMSVDDLSINNPDFYNDTGMYELLGAAKTNGCFQVESGGMKDLLVRLKPSNLEDVSAVLALYRPDSMPMLEEFIHNKHNPDDITYIHPDMKPILESTYGCMIYQEQLMDIVRIFGGRTYGGADKFRKGIGKKDKELIKTESEKLYKEIIANGYDESLAKQISDTLSEKGGYLFNHCLSGDTVIKRSSFGGKTKYIPTIEEMYRIKNDVKYSKDTGHFDLHKKYCTSRFGYGKALSMQDDERARVNRIVDIRYAGKQELFKVTLENGSYIKATANHKFPTPNGIFKLEDLNIGDSLYVLGEYEKCKNKYNFTHLDHSANMPKKGQIGFQKQEYSATNNFYNTKKYCVDNKFPCEVCGREYSDNVRFELHHKDLNRCNNDIDNFQWVCVSCHKKLHYNSGRVKRYEKGIPCLKNKIISIESVGIEDTYDVEMEHPYHNFAVSTGIITSNSHSALYSILTLKTAYLKKHHPTEFFCALFNQNRNDFGALNKYLIDSNDFYVRTLPPHINKSQRTFSVSDHSIRFGLEAIKGIGANVVDLIINEREKRKFNSFEDVLSRTSLSTAHIVSLIKAGAIPCKSKSSLLNVYASTLFQQAEYKPVKTYGSSSKLLLEWDIDVNNYKEGKKIDKDKVLEIYNKKRELKFANEQKEKREKHFSEFEEKYMQDEDYWEFEALSIFLTNNPFKEAYKYIEIKYDDIDDGENCVVVGIISKIQKKKDRNKNKYAFINMNSAFGLFEVTCWSHQYKEYEDIISRGSKVAVYVKKSGDKAVVQSMKTYDQWLSDRKIKMNRR